MLNFFFCKSSKGELKLASQMQADETENSVPKLKKFRQKKREVQCAVNLAQKLQPFIDNNENAEVGLYCRCVLVCVVIKSLFAILRRRI